MSFNWKRPKVFKRFSSIYTFTRNPLLKRSESHHVYIPWTPEVIEDLMFQLKARVFEAGFTYIPYMDLSQNSEYLNKEDFRQLQTQIENNVETHLVMSDLDSIHIFRVIGIVKHKGPLVADTAHYIEGFSELEAKYWFKVDDIYVADANHLGSTEGITASLEELVCKDQTQKIFATPTRQRISPVEIHEKWVNQGRSLTYDYFIRSCELKDNIYQESWDYLSRNTQHELISCELKKNRSVFERGHGKAKLLVESFGAYRDALIAELNEIYILPLVNAIESYSCLEEAWGKIQENGLINRGVTQYIQDILDGKSCKIEDLTTFLFYVKNAKSFLFSLKNMFEKKIHKEEFLLVESFLYKQESLIDSFSCRSLDTKVLSVIEIEAWINKNSFEIHEANLDELKDLNLKLSYLLSIMGSASYSDNIFFHLVEEKALKGIVQKSFEDEVKGLLSYSFKKDSA